MKFEIKKIIEIDFLAQEAIKAFSFMKYTDYIIYLSKD